MEDETALALEGLQVDEMGDVEELELPGDEIVDQLLAGDDVDQLLAGGDVGQLLAGGDDVVVHDSVEQ